MSIICMIPVRTGSTRLIRKNYLKLGNETVYDHCILKAKLSDQFDRIIINSEDTSLQASAKARNIDFYTRKKSLASSDARSDEVVFDLMNSLQTDFEMLVWLNTASPLTTVADINNFVSKFKNSDAISAVTVNSINTHSIYSGKPVNFDWTNGFEKTQELQPVSCFNYAIMGWKPEALTNISNKMLFDKNLLLVESSFWANILMKTPDDFKLINHLYNTAYTRDY